MKTAIMVCCHNHSDMTEKLLESLEETLKSNEYDLYILENGCTDNTSEIITPYKKRFTDNICQVFTPTNLGFAEGNNILITTMLEKKRKYKNVIFLNNDTLVTKAALDLLVRVCNSDKSVGAAGPMSNNVSGLQKLHATGYRLISDKDYKDYANEIVKSSDIHVTEVGRLVGFCLCVKTEVLEKLTDNYNYEVFNHNYNIGMFEDDDLCLRIRNAGYKLIIVKESYIWHYGSQTIKDFDYTKIYKENKEKFFRNYRKDKKTTLTIVRMLPNTYQGKLASPYREEEHFGITIRYDTRYYINSKLPSQELLAEIASHSSWILTVYDNEQFVINNDVINAILGYRNPAIDLYGFKIIHMKAPYIEGDKNSLNIEGKNAADWQGRLMRLRKKFDGTYYNFNEVPMDCRDYLLSHIYSFDDINAEMTVSQKKLYDISAAIIVKNEEKYIRQCIDSIKDFVSQIVIVDTGSTDNTLDIIKDIQQTETDLIQVIHHPWQNSFSEARNVSLKACTSSWILRIDADETIPDATKVNFYNAICNQEADAFLVPIKNYKPDGTAPMSPTIRLFRNIKGIKYHNRVHEEIEASLKKLNLSILKINSHMDHFGYLKGIQDQKSDMYFNLLMLDYKDNPNDLRTLMNIANHYFHHEKLSLAVQFYKECMAHGGDKDFMVLHDYAVAKYQLMLRKIQPEVNDILYLMNKAQALIDFGFPEHKRRLEANLKKVKELEIKELKVETN